MVEAKAKGWRTGIKVALMCLGVLVLSLELGVRFLFPSKVRAWRPDLEELMSAGRTVGHPYISFVGRPNFATAPDARPQKSQDEWGLRGNKYPPAKPEGVYRIICLGGSSTYGHTPTSDEATWPARLEHWLNDQYDQRTIQVINAGMSGYSTFESLANLAFRMVEWEPDLVIVYHTINDMRCALHARGGPITIDNTQWRAIWPRVVQTPGESALEHSVTFLMLRAAFTGYVKSVNDLATYNIVNYDKQASDPYLREGIPATGFENFERNLRTIQAIAKEFGAEVLFASQACDERDIRAGSREQQLAGMARMTEILERVAREKGLVWVDARAEFEQLAGGPDENWDTLFTNEVHLTNKGAERLALILAREILRELLPK